MQDYNKFIQKINLRDKLMIAFKTIEILLEKIHKLENNDQITINDKFSEIKKIREEMSKVSAEIDILKKEITLLNIYQVN